MWKILIVLLSLTSIGIAADPWPNPPATISTPGQNGSDPQIAVDPNGNIVALWIENGVVMSNWATVGGSWSPIIFPVSNAGAESPQLQIDLNGTATALWIENGVVYAASMVLQGGWSSPTAVSGSGASSPSLSIDASGNLVAVWEEGGMIQSSTCLVGGSFSDTPDTLYPSGGSSPQVAIGNNGSVIAVWEVVIGETSSVYAAIKSLTSSWATATLISATGVNAIYPQVAIDPQGNGSVVWFTYPQSGVQDSNLSIAYVELPFGGSWSTPVTLSNSWNGDPADFILKIAAAPNGNVIAAWSILYNNHFFGIQYSVMSNGQWNQPGPIVYFNLLSPSFDLAISPRGDAGVAWMYYDGADGYLKIESGVIDITSVSIVFSSLWSLSNGGNNGFPFIGINDSNGNVYSAVAWENSNGLQTSIQAVNGVFVEVQPPSNLNVVQNENDFGVLTQLENVLTWSPSPSSNVINYLIFRNGVYINAVEGTTLQYVDPNCLSGQTVTYGVAACDSVGCQSSTLFFTFMN